MNQNHFNQPNAQGAPMVFFPGPGQPSQQTVQQPQQQPGIQFAWPAQYPQMMLNGQQWAQPQLQGGVAQVPQFPQGPLQSSAAEIAAAVAAAMRPILQETKSTPAGSDPEDERILTAALKKGHAEGLTSRQAIQKLHNVNNHTEGSWKDFYLDHDKKLFPKIYGFLAISSSLSPRRDGGAEPTHSRHPLPRRNVDSANSSKKHSNARSKASTRKGRGSDGVTDSSPLPQRSKRGGPVDEYHAGTYIPPYAGSKKPKAPRRISGDERFKFTDEDKVFLIHYLRWRLRQGNVPEKADLFEELAEQTHHGVDAWKRHWQQNAELPDRLLAQAKKQYAEEQPESEPFSDDDGEEEEDEGGERDESGEGSYDNEPAEGHSNTPARARPARRGRVTAVRVTEDDLRAMAQYKAERLEGWFEYSSRKGAWKEFWERPGNEKRSLNAWFCAARDHAEELQEYVQEYLANGQQEAQSDAEPTPLQQDEAYTSSTLTPSHQTEHQVANPRKRSAEQTNALEDMAPAAKRTREETDVEHDGPAPEPKAESVKQDEDEPEVIEILISRHK